MDVQPLSLLSLGGEVQVCTGSTCLLEGLGIRQECLLSHFCLVKGNISSGFDLVSVHILVEGSAASS